MAELAKKAARLGRTVLSNAQAQNARTGQGMREGVTAAYRESVPVHVRTYGETILGNRAPITERDFGKKEMKALRALVSNKTPKPRATTAFKPDPEFASLFPETPAIDPYDTAWDKEHPTASARERRGGGSVGYADYGDVVGDIVRPEYADPAVNAVANTLGRFTFEKDGKGGHIISDSYDFANPEESERAKRYKRDGRLTARGIITILSDAARGDVGAIGRGILGPADARPVRVRVPK